MLKFDGAISSLDRVKAHFCVSMMTGNLVIAKTARKMFSLNTCKNSSFCTNEPFFILLNTHSTTWLFFFPLKFTGVYSCEFRMFVARSQHFQVD